MFVAARQDRSDARNSGPPTKRGELGAVQGTPRNAEATYLAERAAAAARAAEVARASERALNQSAAIMGAGSAAVGPVGGPYGAAAGAVLGVGAGVAAGLALSAGAQAETFEKEAGRLRQQAGVAKAKADTEKKAAAQKKAEADAKAKKQAQPKKSSSGGRDNGGFRGDTYGGRASAHDPGRAERISRTC